MSSSPNLSPPGSATLSFNATGFYVGDGTWDSATSIFLLPPLVGLNFKTMQYNGMKNRFLEMPGYHSLIKAHGILAAITFLGLVPAGIILARFLGHSRYWAIRLHIWLQITTFLLATVVFILGFFAVGPLRSLTNPHHGIGVAIYVLVIVQLLGGWLIHTHGRGRTSAYIPLRAMLHHWLGRAVALLGMAQIPLGLTLYGSPEYLFILYAVYMFALLVAYFLLTWRHQRHIDDYDVPGSHISADEVADDRRRPRRSSLGGFAAAGAAGAGLATLFRRRSNRNESRVEAAGTDESGTSNIASEKHSDTSNPGLGHRFLGGVAAIKSLFSRKDRRNESSGDRPYAQGGSQYSDSVSRIEEGRAPANRPVTPIGDSPGYIQPTHPLANPPMTPGRPQSPSSLSYSSFMSGSPSRHDRRGHGMRDAFATGGAMFALRQAFKSRRQRKEDRRVEDARIQRTEEERLARAASRRHNAGGGITPPRGNRRAGTGSQAGTSFTGSVVGNAHQRPGATAAAPVAGVGAAAASALAERDRVRPIGTDPVVTATGGPSMLPADIPPIPPVHGSNVGSSGSEIFTTASGRRHHRHHLQEVAGAAMAGAALGGAAAEGSRRRHSGRQTDSMESPPISVKVKMHKDGNHVTLRRLTEEEALTQREERRRERRAASGQRRRNSSFSSSEGGDRLGGRDTSVDRRWRRTDALERQQAEAAAAAAGTPASISVGALATAPPPAPPLSTAALGPSQVIDPRTGQSFNVPPPPPIPATSSGLVPPGSVTSPGTETSTEYANNRRRRRAERAQARLVREGRTGGGPTVDFT